MDTTNEQINNLKKEIMDIQKQYSYIDFKLKQFILSILQNDTNVKTKTKGIGALLNDMYNIINGLGELKLDDAMLDSIKTHCCKLGLDYQIIHTKLHNIIQDKYTNVNKECYALLRTKLKQLCNLTHGTELRLILRDCFQIHREIPYDRIKYLLINILKDKYVYTQQKIDPSCEHVIPKKFFNGNKPMSADMHHIFLAPTIINNCRNIMKLCEIDNTVQCSYIDGKGNIKFSSLSNKYNGNKFCPEHHSKGRIARACAYFFTMYPEVLPYIHDVIDINDMKTWCNEFIPSKQEHKRNYFIYQVQKSFNPYIIYPDLVNYVYRDINSSQFIKSKLTLQLNSMIHDMLLTSNTVNSIIDQYIDATTEPDEQVTASQIIVQHEKIKSSINKILNILS